MTTSTAHTSPLVRVRRVPQNARYDRDSVHRVLGRGLIPHVSFTSEGQPFCIPTLYARTGDRILIHGSTASRMFRLLAAGAPACLTVTLLDGLVLARSAFETGANYDSVVLFGRFHAITGDEQKTTALKTFVEAVLPGRWQEVRPPTRQELKGTTVLELAIEQASAKTRSGPPDDDHSPDAQRATWASVIPVTTRYGTPQPSPGLRPRIPVSPSLKRLLAE